jgi:Ala-tRNA(Pro) deacylase
MAFIGRCTMKVLEFLEKSSVAYEVSEHKPTFTAQQMAAEVHVPGMQVAKPVVVKADNEYYMCVLPASHKVDFDKLQKQLGVEKVELAEEREMVKLFPDCALGAEPPLGVLYGFVTLMDKTLEADKHIVFQGGSHEKAIKMEMGEYKRLVRPRILDFSYASR